MSDTPGSPAADDDSVLERVGDLVDDVLGEDLEPPEPEDRWERRQRILDSWTAIILAVAAVATAWATFQASQWSGTQSDAQSASAMARADAGRAASEASGAQVVDSQMWLSWLNAVANKQSERARFYQQRFSPQLAAAQKEWLGSVPSDAQGVPTSVPTGTPMDQPSYVVPAEAEANRLSAFAEDQLVIADDASSVATRFVLHAVLLALVLFFASVATKFGSPKLQVLLITVALVLLGVSVLRMLLLPQLL